MKKYFFVVLAIVLLSGCGTLDNKMIMIDPGDSKEKVVKLIGAPYDRQFQGNKEAWQYCVSGAGIGYNDHKIVWFTDKKVTGITTYRSHRTGCTGYVKTIEWEEAPDYTLEVRNR